MLAVHVRRGNGLRAAKVALDLGVGSDCLHDGVKELGRPGTLLEDALHLDAGARHVKDLVVVLKVVILIIAVLFLLLLLTIVPLHANLHLLFITLFICLINLHLHFGHYQWHLQGNMVPRHVIEDGNLPEDAALAQGDQHRATARFPSSAEHLNAALVDDVHLVADVPPPADVVVGQKENRPQLEDQVAEDVPVNVPKELHPRQRGQMHGEGNVGATFEWQHLEDALLVEGLLQVPGGVQPAAHPRLHVRRHAHPPHHRRALVQHGSVVVGVPGGIRHNVPYLADDHGKDKDAEQPGDGHVDALKGRRRLGQAAADGGGRAEGKVEAAEVGAVVLRLLRVVVVRPGRAPKALQPTDQKVGTGAQVDDGHLVAEGVHDAKDIGVTGAEGVDAREEAPEGVHLQQAVQPGETLQGPQRRVLVRAQVRPQQQIKREDGHQVDLEGSLSAVVGSGEGHLLHPLPGLNETQPGLEPGDVEQVEKVTGSRKEDGSEEDAGGVVGEGGGQQGEPEDVHTAGRLKGSTEEKKGEVGVENLDALEDCTPPRRLPNGGHLLLEQLPTLLLTAGVVPLVAKDGLEGKVLSASSLCRRPPLLAVGVIAGAVLVAGVLAVLRVGVVGQLLLHEGGSVVVGLGEVTQSLGDPGRAQRVGRRVAFGCLIKRRYRRAVCWGGKKVLHLVNIPNLKNTYSGHSAAASSSPRPPPRDCPLQQCADQQSKH
ncbi:hypothetical protein TYRP_013813 [Tyrophagus putrescentiae]|nr:hypothetical protein TYRP_013813 [Tyrophagus putrescentiae]